MIETAQQVKPQALENVPAALLNPKVQAALPEMFKAVDRKDDGTREIRVGTGTKQITITQRTDEERNQFYSTDGSAADLENAVRAYHQTQRVVIEKVKAQLESAGASTVTKNGVTVEKNQEPPNPATPAFRIRTNEGTVYSLYADGQVSVSLAGAALKDASTKPLIMSLEDTLDKMYR